MTILFYISAVVAIVSTVMVITRLNAVHALLYLVVSLLSVAVVFYLLGAPFAAALEVIIYAGAIMVLFIFVVMMLHVGDESVKQEMQWLKPSMWAGPAILAMVLLIEIGFVIFSQDLKPGAGPVVQARQVGLALYGPYLIGVELAAILLLAGIVGAYHLGKEKTTIYHRFLKQRDEND
jgi:NADH-quinone oxidoreductase subunit J